MRKVDLPIFSARWRRAALLVAAGLAWTGCHRALPCSAPSSCPRETVCGLDGACAPEPSPESARFVTLRSLSAQAARGPRTPDGRGLCFGPDDAVELDFGPITERLVAAELRLSPAPVPAPTTSAVVRVRSGRARVSVAYRVGAGRPLLVDVSSLVDAGAESSTLSLTATERVCITPPDVGAVDARPRLTVSEP